MLVEEHIRVRAEGKQIKRGIYRDFPTKYRDRLNNNYQVLFELVEVTRNGTSESYHTKQLSNGIGLYIGSRDSFIEPGEHAYSIVYKTKRQIGFSRVR